MGCDIHTHAEINIDGSWHKSTKKVFYNSLYSPDSKFVTAEAEYIDIPFDWRSYGMYGFLADVRNYSHVPVIADIRGFPSDASSEVSHDYYEYWGLDAHSASYLTLRELLEYDYDQIFEDRRTIIDGNGAADAGEGNGEKMSIREFLGTDYFQQIEDMKKLGNPDNVRVVFWFDN